MKIIICFAIMLFSLASAIAQETDVNKSVIVVSDIDDTIRLTMIHHQGHFLRYVAGLFQQKAFIGMPALYNFLAAKGATFKYVSGTPEILKRILPAKFIELAGFPVGDLFDRPSTKDSIEDFKYNRILELMRANPKADFVFIGDNGQRDIVTYERLKANAEVSDRVRDVYIHKLYGAPNALELTKGQIPYFTSADLAVSMSQKGYIGSSELRVVLESVRNGFSHTEKSVRERTLPLFTPIGIEDLKYLNDLASGLPDKGSKAVFRSIITAAEIENASYSKNRMNLSCRELLLTAPSR